MDVRVHFDGSVTQMNNDSFVTSNPMNSERVSKGRQANPPPNRNWRSKMSTPAVVVSLKAKQGEGSEVVRLITAVLPHIEREEGTPLWLVLRSSADPDTVFLVDIFRDVASRDLHMSGEAAKQVLATVPPLLAEEPRIHPADLIVQKGV
jgi:quinol monooxygenase YgiN